MTNEMNNMIVEWFANAPSATFMLPDGWFGRPHDSYYPLTCFIARPHKTILELDNEKLMTFTDLNSAKIESHEGHEGKKLVLSHFLLMVFDWQSNPSWVLPNVQIYQNGSVTFFAPWSVGPYARYVKAMVL